MTTNLNGIRFDQIYGDNSGGPEFDSDGDGTATQEDEFVSITNSQDAPMDISGWQIWSDSTGTNAPDSPQDGLYHTFPPGTVLAPGETLYVINEISGSSPSWAQEASEGGVESGAGGVSTNLLTEGAANGNASEAVALVDPYSGDYIVFNMASASPTVQTQSGFPGTNNLGIEDGHSTAPDQGAGWSYRYNPETDSYDYTLVSVPCYIRGTLIHTPSGRRPIEALRPGDLVLTQDSGPQPIRWVGVRRLDRSDLQAGGQHPIELKPGSIGPKVPDRRLCVSPQHRILLPGDVLAPARGLLDLPGVRVMRGCREVSYHHLLLDDHHIIFAEGTASESLLPGRTYLSGYSISDRLAIMRVAGPNAKPARRCLTVAEARQYTRSVSGAFC